MSSLTSRTRRCLRGPGPNGPVPVELGRNLAEAGPHLPGSKLFLLLAPKVAESGSNLADINGVCPQSGCVRP